MSAEKENKKMLKGVADLRERLSKSLEGLTPDPNLLYWRLIALEI